MKLPRRQFLHLTAGTAALPAVSRIAWAQTYPARPILLVVPFPPGGAFDTLARPWVKQVKPLLGTMIVENIGGGGTAAPAARWRKFRRGSFIKFPRLGQLIFNASAETGSYMLRVSRVGANRHHD
jgi:tripartite-type tricarboxylate transporter receptor subunit TctC